MSLSKKFGIPESLFEAAKKALDESNAYQQKVKAHMAKKGIKSLDHMSTDEKKKFFNELDAMHTAKNEEVEIEEVESVDEDQFDEATAWKKRGLEDPRAYPNTREKEARKGRGDVLHPSAADREAKAKAAAYGHKKPTDSQVRNLKTAIKNRKGLVRKPNLPEEIELELDEASTHSGNKIEAKGVKGMKSTPWQKVFSSQKAFEQWLEKNSGDYEVHATREIPSAFGPSPADKLSIRSSANEEVDFDDLDLEDVSIEDIENFMQTEDFDQLDELSKTTLGNYIKKRSNDVATQGAITRKHAMDSEAARNSEDYVQARKSNEKADKAFAKGWKHRQNIGKAVDKLTKEDVEQVDELSKETLGSYVRRASSSGVSNARSAGVELGVGASKRKDKYNSYEDKAEKRLSGISKAVHKLTKEEQEFIESLNAGTAKE